MTDSSPEILDHLDALVEELGTVSRRLRSLHSPQSGQAAWMGCEGGAELATFLFDVRRIRDVVFDHAALDDCAWDMLLDLAKSDMEGIPVSVSALCAATARPQTSALRKLNGLVDAGLVQRHPDVRDRRRVLVELTDKARQSMDALYEQTVQKRLPRPSDQLVIRS